MRGVWAIAGFPEPVDCLPFFVGAQRGGGFYASRRILYERSRWIQLLAPLTLRQWPVTASRGAVPSATVYISPPEYHGNNRFIAADSLAITVHLYRRYFLVLEPGRGSGTDIPLTIIRDPSTYGGFGYSSRSWIRIRTLETISGGIHQRLQRAEQRCPAGRNRSPCRMKSNA